MSNRAVEQLHDTASALLTRTVPEENQVTMSVGRVLLTAQRSSALALRGYSLATGNSSVQLPDMGGIADNNSYIDVQVCVQIEHLQ